MKKVLLLFTSISLLISPSALLVSCKIPRNVYHNIYILGDSLSDTGELVGVIDQLGASIDLKTVANIQFSDPSYNHHNFSNGKVTVEVLAEKLGLKLNSGWSFNILNNKYHYEQKGNNYAIGGAIFATDPSVLGLLLYNRFRYNDQINAMLSQHNISNNDLIVLEGGNNDLLDVIRTKNQSEAQMYLKDALNNEKAAIKRLLKNNVKHLLILNVPNLSQVPEFVKQNIQEKNRISNFVRNYDNSLNYYLTNLSIKYQQYIKEYDLWNAFDKYLTIAKRQNFNITDPVVSIDYYTPKQFLQVNYCKSKNKSSFNNSFFYDEVHPSAWTHHKIGTDLFQLVKNWNEINY